MLEKNKHFTWCLVGLWHKNKQNDYVSSILIMFLLFNKSTVKVSQGNMSTQ